MLPKPSPNRAAAPREGRQPKAIARMCTPEVLTPEGFAGLTPEGTSTDALAPDMKELLEHPPEAPASCPQNGGTLYLRNQGIDDGCCDLLAQRIFLLDFDRVQMLMLACNSIGPRGMAMLGGAMGGGYDPVRPGGLPYLESLSLETNPLGDAGIQTLANSLSALPRLRSLEIQRTGCGDEGMRAIARAAMDAGALGELDTLYCHENAVGCDGVTALCEALKEGKLQSLGCLHLPTNKVDDEGCLALTEAIEAGHLDHMRAIYLGAGNPVTRDGMEVLYDIVREHEKRLKIYF